jgi:hypothetical protein
MKMTPGQRRAVVEHRNNLLSRMGATLRRRRDISLELLHTLGAANGVDEVSRLLTEMLFFSVPSQLPEMMWKRSGGCSLYCFVFFVCSCSCRKRQPFFLGDLVMESL